MKNPLIGERLKFYREQNNLTIKQVSAILSETYPVADKTIYGWESGRSQPDIDTLMRLCCIYEIDNILECFEYKTTNKTAKKTMFKLSAQEKHLVEEYRKHPNMQEAIQKLLDIEQEN